jgi:hypothetical protein
MKHRSTALLAVLLLKSATGAWAAAGDDSFTSYSGIATSGPSEKFLYRENHVLHFRGGRIAERVVLYTCRDGAPFARKTVSYGDDLSPDFVLEDASNGMRQGIRTRAGVREVFFRQDTAAVERSGAVPREAGSVADSGFDGFVRTNWQSLLDGHAMGMNFLVPSRLQEMGFKVQHVGSDRVNGVAVEVFRLKLSGALGWIAPSIDVYYSNTDHVLMRYVGVSDLRDPSHDNYVAKIDFRPGDRRPGDERVMAAARQASLAPCR